MEKISIQLVFYFIKPFRLKFFATIKTTMYHYNKIYNKFISYSITFKHTESF